MTVALHLIGLMGWDVAAGGTKLGEGSKARCLSSNSLYTELKREESNKVRVLAAAGKHDSRQKYTLAEMMLAWLESKAGVNLRDTVFLEDRYGRNIFGSRAEIERFYEYADSRGEAYVMHIVSHWWHIPRLWIIVKLLGRRAQFHATKGLHYYMLLEIYKIPAELLRFTSPTFGKVVAQARRRSF